MGIPACGSDCLNRLLLIECGKRCPCGEFCTNRNFKNKNNAKIAPFKTELKGWGIKSLNDIKGYDQNENVKSKTKKILKFTFI